MIPGLAILLLATIGAARVAKVSLAAIRSAVRYVRDVHREVTRRRAAAVVAAVPAARGVSQADRDAIVEECLARLWREGNAGDTMVDVRAGRRARA